MDDSIVEFFTTLAPSGVYLGGLILAIRHIASLYELRHDEQTKAHLAQIKAVDEGHEARIQAVERAAEECIKDRTLLREELKQDREELRQLRERMIDEAKQRRELEKEVRTDGPGFPPHVPQN